MPDCFRKRITQLPFATPHQNSVFQRILGHLAKFIQVLVEHLDFSVQAMSFPDESCQRTGLDDIIKFTLPNVGPASAILDVGNPNCRGCMPSNTRWMTSRRQPMPLFAQAPPEKTTVFAQGVP